MATTRCQSCGVLVSGDVRADVVTCSEQCRAASACRAYRRQRGALSQAKTAPEEQAETGIGFKLVGGAVFVLGVVLFLGNRSGALPTFPYAGYLVMGIGATIWATEETA
jgi:hypothetical protein